MNTQTKPAVEKAISFIRNSLYDGIFKQGDRLPGIRKLACSARVSCQTMWNAIGVLRHEGVVSVQDKTGIFIGKEVPIHECAIKGPRKLKWQNVQEKIRKDIFERKFPNPQKLPSYKELMAWYKTGYSIIKKVLDVLIQENVIVPDRRGFVVTTHSMQSTINTVYCIIGESLFGNTTKGYELAWMDAFFRSLEQECVLKNIHLVKEQYSLQTLPAIIGNLNSTMGLIVIYSPFVDKLFLDVIPQLLDLHKPVSIINIVGHIHPSVLYTAISSKMEKLRERSPHVFLYTMFNQDKRAGIHLGRILLEKGHKKVAYFSYQTENRWAAERYDGVKEAFAGVGLPDAVAAFATPMNSAYQEIENKESLEWGIQKYGPEYRFVFETAQNIEQKYPDGFFTGRMWSQIYNFRYQTRIYRDFISSFKTAIADKEITAWISCNDDVAIYGILAFFNEQKIKVQKRPGLVAFDDKIEASLHNLTSYNFNYAGVARHMLNLVLYPTLMKKKKNGLPLFDVQIDGMVIDRGSI